MCWAKRILIVIGCVIMTGCTGGMREIDDQTARLIRERQQRTLGAEAEADPQIVPPLDARSSPSRQAYELNPSTRNDPPSKLPVQTAPPQDDLSLVITPEIYEDPDALQMNLEHVLSFAIGNSREYRSQKEDLFLTAIDLLVERHLWGPRFFNTVTAAFSGTPESGDHDQALELVNQFSVTQRLPYGGNVSASALVSYVNLLQTDAAHIGDRDEQRTSLSFAATFPLLRGAGESARESYIQSHRNLIYATRRFEDFRRGFLVDISSNYYDLLRQRANIDNLARQVANFEWLVQRIDALARAGRAPYFEVQRAQQQVLFARNNLVNAQERFAAAMDNFKIRIGLPISQSLMLLPVEVVVPSPLLDVQSAVLTAFDQRLDLQTAGDQLEDARRGTDVASNQLLPDLDLFGNVGIATESDNRIGGLDFDAGEGSYAAGVRLGVPLDRRIEQLRYRRSLVTAERAHRSYSLLRDRIATDVRQSVRAIQQAQFSLDLQNRNIDIAEKRLRGVLLRLRTLGPRDFIEAQDDLLEARDRRDSAVRDLRVNILQYLIDTGQMRVTATGQWLPPARLQPVATPEPEPDPANLMKNLDELDILDDNNQGP